MRNLDVFLRERFPKLESYGNFFVKVKCNICKGIVKVLLRMC